MVDGYVQLSVGWQNFVSGNGSVSRTGIIRNDADDFYGDIFVHSDGIWMEIRDVAFSVSTDFEAKIIAWHTTTQRDTPRHVLPVELHRLWIG